MKVLLTFLILALSGASLAWADDEKAEGETRACNKEDQSCFKNEVQRAATYPAPIAVQKRVNALTGADMTPPQPKKGEGSAVSK